jgi:RNA polymerase sigma-70 factor (ECF subfamily)
MREGSPVVALRTANDIGPIFRQYHDALYRYLVRFSGDPDLSADAAQEAFIRLAEHPPAEGAERAWLYRVATHVLVSDARTRLRRLRLLTAGQHRAPLGEPPRDPHELVEANERRRMLESALACLSKKQRMALLMRAEGFTHREIAEALGTTTGSIGTLVARALAALGRQFDQGHEDTR